MTLQVLLDTNILIFIAEGKFNLHSEIERLIPQQHELIILTACMEELKVLATQKPKMARILTFVEKLLEKIKLVEYNPRNIRLTDDRIVRYSRDHPDNCIVATNDLGLKRKLLKHNLPIIFVRGKNHLELIGLSY
ncbi:MAG: type II toxin-antitoxin system VapC family toxin [Candidatus Heimdallarchaeota archaeon]